MKRKKVFSIPSTASPEELRKRLELRSCNATVPAPSRTSSRQRSRTARRDAAILESYSGR